MNDNMISEKALKKAHEEYDKYKLKFKDILSPVEKDFISNINVLETIVDKK